MKGKVATALLVLLAVVVLAWIELGGRHKPEALYQGKSLRTLVEHAVLDFDQSANSELDLAIGTAKGPAKAQIQSALADCTLRSLKIRNCVFWRPYNYLKGKAPISISRLMGDWREPRLVRKAAASWLSSRAEPWNPRPAIPGLNEAAGPILYDLARHDPDSDVRRAEFRALGTIGVYSDEIFQLMLSSLGQPEPAVREAAVKWFRKNTLAPEKVVPVLVRGLEDNSMRSEYARTLIAYGPKANFEVQPLIVLAKTNDRATASVASWALYAIDTKAATNAGVSP